MGGVIGDAQSEGHSCGEDGKSCGRDDENTEDIKPQETHQGSDLIRDTGRSAFRRASMNEVNVSLVLPLSEYVSSCSLGKSSRGCSPSSNWRQRESSLTSPLSIQRVFRLVNDLRSLRHLVRLTSLCSSDDWLWTLRARVRCSTAEKIWLSADILTHGYMRNTRIGRDVREVGCYAPLLIFGARATYLSHFASSMTAYHLCVLPARLSALPDSFRT